MSIAPGNVTTMSQKLEALALAMMIGGMLVLGAFVAPTVFHTLPLAQAGPLMTGLFRSFDTVLLGAFVVVVLCEALRVTKQGFPKHLGGRFRWVCLALLATLLSWNLGVVHPQIEAYQQAGVSRGVGPQGQDFDRLHHQSETTYKTQLLLSAGMLVLLF